METQKNEINFKSFLQNEFISRCRNNGNYSLRAFARSLKLSPAALSEMIKGKRPITSKTQAKIALLLRLSPDQMKKIAGTEAQENIQHNNYNQLTLDSFAFIADWYHFAILELLAIKDFKADVPWIARRLSINLAEANIAVERLLRLGLLKRDKKGGFKDGTSGHTSSLTKGVTSEAAQRYQIQILQKAIDAIGKVPLDWRDNTSMTFAIDTNDLPKAKLRIEKFRRDMDSLFKKNKDANEVYQLAIALFPLTRMNLNIENSTNLKGQ